MIASWTPTVPGHPLGKSVPWTSVDQLWAKAFKVFTSVRSCCTVVEPTPSPNSSVERGGVFPAIPSTESAGTGIIVTFM